MPPKSSSEELEVGFISGVFGVRGEVRLHLHNRESSLFARGREVTLVDPDGPRRQIVLHSRSGAGRRVIGRIEGLNGRDEAAALQGHRMVMRVAELPATRPDEFYVRDVVDLPVFVGEDQVGTVVDVHRTGPVDIFEVASGEERRFIPALAEFIDTVDVSGGRVVMFALAFEV